jgi:F420-non-reducing hydrogenase iron-sulfur subunit
MHEQNRRTKIVVLYCQHCVTRRVESRTATQEHDGVVVQTAMMPCSCKVQASELLKLMAAGADGVEIVACPDAACRHLVGSRTAEKRLGYVQRLLKEADVRGDRLGFSWKSAVGSDELQAMGLRRASVVEASRGGRET